MRFIPGKMIYATRLSIGDYKDRSVENEIKNCPVGNAVLVEPDGNGRYLVRVGKIAKTIVTTNLAADKPAIIEKTEPKKKRAVKKGKKNAS